MPRATTRREDVTLVQLSGDSSHAGEPEVHRFSGKRGDDQPLAMTALSSASAACEGTGDVRGTSISHLRPSTGYSSCTSEKTALSNLVPKPWRKGAATDGPPLSCHLNFNTKPGSLRLTVQETVIFPALLESAPCLAELVASSCKTSVKFCAVCGVSTTLGPAMVARPENASNSLCTS